MSLDTLQQLAADYVLGTLTATERKQVQTRLPTDAALREAVQEWEGRLAPLAELAEPVTPAANLWQRIELSLPPEPMARSQSPKQAWWTGWWSSLAFWRFAAGASFAAAAVMAVAPMTGLVNPAQPKYMVVLVAPNATAPGWVIQASTNKRLKLVPLAKTEVPEQRALQFWTKADDWNAPVSLGLIKPGQPLDVSLEQLPAIQANQLFEITLEPPSGSPTGRPTGPVLYIGRSVKMI
jgi:anti-sigma-K factor RskA